MLHDKIISADGFTCEKCFSIQTIYELPGNKTANGWLRNSDLRGTIV